jgi:site-specific recombinase XerD
VQERHADPVRAANSVAHWQAFFALERSLGLLTGAPTVADITRSLCDRFIKWRLATGVSPHTVSRDLASLRSPLRWAWQNERIPAAPFIPDVKDKPGPKELVYDAQQVAALIEAAARLPDRWHVRLFTLIMLSTHGRVEAVLELDASQIRDGLIYFNAPGRQQTRKRRSIVPVAPTLAPWLDDVQGKVIRYRAQVRQAAWADPAVPEYLERPCLDIGNSFAACLVEAGLTRPACSKKALPTSSVISPLNEISPEQKPLALGSPNTLRHTCSTEMHTRGVPEAQIETAAGHRGETTNTKNYRHLRPEYLKEFIAGVEDYWREVGRFTKAHLRYRSDTIIIDLATRDRRRRDKKLAHRAT